MPERADCKASGLKSFGSEINVAVIGAGGGIGGAFVDHLRSSNTVSSIFQLARSSPASDSQDHPWIQFDLEDERSIERGAKAISNAIEELHLVIVATGILHDGNSLKPEKTWRSLSPRAMETAFKLNTVGPALAAKHFLPLLAKNRKSVFAALSARVGSIEDNQLGGWYAYRASKAALNMVIKTLSIELVRRNPGALCIGLHPGTVDSELSKPFHMNVPEGRLFSPAQSTGYLLRVLDQLGPQDSGGVYAWDGSQIPY